eukprot:jgi/Tetstr1/439401/TSEL_027835.t1
MTGKSAVRGGVAAAPLRTGGENPTDALFAAVDIDAAQQTAGPAAAAGPSATASASDRASKRSRGLQGRPPDGGSEESHEKRRRGGGGEDGEVRARADSDAEVAASVSWMKAQLAAEERTGLDRLGVEAAALSGCDDDDEEEEEEEEEGGAEVGPRAEDVAAMGAEERAEVWAAEREARLAAQTALRQNRKWVRQAMRMLCDVRGRLYDLEGEITKQRAGRLEAQQGNAALQAQASGYDRRLATLTEEVQEARRVQARFVGQLEEEQAAAAAAGGAWTELRGQLLAEEAARKRAIALLRNSERLLGRAFAKLGPEGVEELTKDMGVTTAEGLMACEAPAGAAATAAAAAAASAAAVGVDDASLDGGLAAADAGAGVGRSPEALVAQLQKALQEERAARNAAEAELAEEQQAHRMLRGAHREAINLMAKQAESQAAMRVGHFSTPPFPPRGAPRRGSSDAVARASDDGSSHGRPAGFLPEGRPRAGNQAKRSASPARPTGMSAEAALFSKYLHDKSIAKAALPGDRDLNGPIPGRQPPQERGYAARGSFELPHHSADGSSGGGSGLHTVRKSLLDGARRSASGEAPDAPPPGRSSRAPPRM